MFQTLDQAAVTAGQQQSGPAGNSLDATYAWIDCALRGQSAAAVAMIDRLAAGDADLWAAVDDPLSSVAEQLREALLRYLTLGSWQGWPIPFPEGSRLSREARALHTRISSAACESAALGWRATLLVSLRDPDPRLRRVAVTLLGACTACDGACALLAAVKLLGDTDERVRWAAAVALARHDGAIVEAILRRLTSSELVPELRHTAAYVLRTVPDAAARRLVAQVVAALDSANYRVAAPVAADTVLRALDASRSGDRH